jgi:hypothetical protein
MSYKAKGTIKSISTPESVGTGKKLSFRIDNGEQYSNIMEFELYKGADYVEHIDNFVKYNKVGDSVEVEFNIKTFNWKPESDDKIFTSLSCWKVEKVENLEIPKPHFEEIGEDLNEKEPDDLPF